MKNFEGTAMRPEHDARRTIVREWMALPGDERQTREQTASFAKKAIEKLGSVPDRHGLAVAANR
jgi:hypothetical protein